MSLASKYLLAEAVTRSGVYTGAGFPTGRRLNWTFTLRVMALAGGGSVHVIVQKAPTDTEDQYTTAHDFTNLSATGPVPKVIALTESDLAIRVIVFAAVGDYTIEVEASAPFLDPALKADQDLLPKEVREWKDGLVRVVTESENNVINILRNGQFDGRLKASINNIAALSLMKQAIALQTQLVLRREELLRNSKDPAAVAELEDLPTVADGVSQTLKPIRWLEETVWRGR